LQDQRFIIVVADNQVLAPRKTVKSVFEIDRILGAFKCEIFEKQQTFVTLHPWLNVCDQSRFR